MHRLDGSSHYSCLSHATILLRYTTPIIAEWRRQTVLRSHSYNQCAYENSRTVIMVAPLPKSIGHFNQNLKVIGDLVSILPFWSVSLSTSAQNGLISRFRIPIQMTRREQKEQRRRVGQTDSHVQRPEQIIRWPRP